MRRPAAGRAAYAWAVAWTVALALCAVSAWSYAGTRGDGSLRYGKARDRVLAAGRQDIALLNTADAAHLDRDLARWLTVTTGPLHAELSRTHAADAAALRRSGTSAGAAVTDAAVTELDTRAGTAKVIATVEVRVTPAAGGGAGAGAGTAPAAGPGPAGSGPGTASGSASASGSSDAGSAGASAGAGAAATTTARKRFEAALSRDGGRWKLSALTAVPIGSS